MAKDDRDPLEILKVELDFLEKGGYGRDVHRPRQQKSIFQDSPSCINFGDPQRSRPCEECLLMELVPAEHRSETIPCHNIPLNSSGESVAGMEEAGNEDRVEDELRNWLRKIIERLEEERVGG